LEVDRLAFGKASLTVSDPLFSVVVCTHNRADYLERALAGIARLNFPPDRFEVLVVDNGSTDDTRQRTVLFLNKPYSVRYLQEPVLGLSVARNTGWREARGRYIAYLDDDAIPSEEWLARAADVIAEGRGDVGMLGGRVEPIWEAPRPTWLGDNLLSLLSMVDLGAEPRYVDEDFGIVGANMIIPRLLLERFGGFSPHVGRIGSSLLSSEEVLLKRTLAKGGYRGYYQPEVCVRHHAPAERLTRKWFIQRFYWQGRSSAALIRLEQPSPGWRRTAQAGLELTKAGVLLVGSMVSGRRFEWRARASGHYGTAVGLVARITTESSAR
jgi:glucosyl-dolichyl phosphate glucuronosyltransferase